MEEIKRVLNKNMPTVLVLSNVFPSGNHNKGMDIKEQIILLKKQFQVIVIKSIPLFLKNKKIKFYQDNSGMFIIELPYLCIPKIGIFSNGVFYSFALFRVFQNILRGIKISAVLTFWIYPEGWGGYFVSKRLNIPFIVRPRGSDINYYSRYVFFKSLIKFPLGKAQVILPVCDRLKNRIIGIGIDKGKVKVIKGGVNHHIFSPIEKNRAREILSLDNEKKILLYIGNLVKVKGVKYLIKAIQNIKDKLPDLLVYIIGTGKEKKSIEKLVGKYGLHKSVILKGEVEYKKISLWINACDLLCLPSLSEGYPNVVLEALACATPVVATNVGGIPEIVDNYKQGILVNPGSPYLFSDAIINALGRRWEKEGLLNKVKYRSQNKVGEEILNEVRRLTDGDSVSYGNKWICRETLNRVFT